MGTYGSRSGAVGMSAISKALDKIEAKAKKVAGHVLEAAEQDIEFKDGKFTVKGTDKSIDFARGRAAGLCRAQVQRPGAGARLEGKRLLGSDQFHLPGRRPHLRSRDRSAKPASSTIDRWTAVDDFGKLINPMIVEGQVHGGVAQGIGQALHGRRGLRRRRPARDRELHGLLHAARRRSAVLPCRHDRDALPLQPARHQGLRRGGRDRFAAGGDQCDHRCARPRERRHAGDRRRSSGAPPKAPR